MALTDQQTFDLKKHLKEPPGSTQLDSVLTTLEDGGTIETNLVTAITAANDALDAVDTARTNADDLTHGGGATFNHPLNISIKMAAHRQAVQELQRLLSWREFDNGSQITGFFNL